VDAVAIAVTVVLIAFGAAAAGFIVRRGRPVFTEGRELQRRLKAVPGERRREIGRALRAGRAVRDPRDAALAADIASNRLRLVQKVRAGKVEAILLGVEILLALAFIAQAIREPHPGLVLALLPLGFLVSVHIFSLRLKKRLELAEKANRALAGELRLANETSAYG
jgi:hypothetical protein